MGDILAGEAPGVDDGELALLWSCVPLRHLLQLVVHAILEATSRRGKWDVKEPATPSRPPGRPGRAGSPAVAAALAWVMATTWVPAVGRGSPAVARSYGR